MSLSVCSFSLLLAMNSCVLLFFSNFFRSTWEDVGSMIIHCWLLERHFYICEISCCLLYNVFLRLQQSVLVILRRNGRVITSSYLLLSVAISFRFSYFMVSVLLSLWIDACVFLVFLWCLWKSSSPLVYLIKGKSEIKHVYLVFRANLIVTDLHNLCIFFLGVTDCR